MKHPNNFHVKLGTKIAQKGNVKRGKVAALAFSKNGELIASACNRRITINEPNKTWTEHAEISLINKLKRLKAFNRYSGITIFVLRITSTGMDMAKPCKKCQEQLNKYPINVLYTGSDGLILSLNGE